MSTTLFKTCSRTTEESAEHQVQNSIRRTKYQEAADLGPENALRPPTNIAPINQDHATGSNGAPSNFQEHLKASRLAAQ